MTMQRPHLRPFHSDHGPSYGGQNPKGSALRGQQTVALSVPISMILPKCYLETISQFKSIVPIDPSN